MQPKRMKVGISIGKQDEDIASWYKMLRDNGLSISEWTVYLILAYIKQEDEFDIGSIADPSMQKEPINPLENIYGSGNTQLSPKEPAAKSFIGISIMNQQAIEALASVREQGWSYTKFIKMLIRRYVRRSSVAEPPSRKGGMMLVDVPAGAVNRQRFPTQEQNRNRKHRRDKKKRSQGTQESSEHQEQGGECDPSPTAELPTIPAPFEEEKPDAELEQNKGESPVHEVQEFDAAHDSGQQDMPEFVLEEEADPPVQESKTPEEPSLSKAKNPFLAMIW